MRHLITTFLILVIVFSCIADDYWVYFTDKGLDSKVDIREYSKQFLTEKALAKRTALGKNPGFYDIPIYQPYIDSLQSMGFAVLAEAKWINAACFRVDDVSQLKDIDFVKKTRLSNTYYRNPDEGQFHKTTHTQMDITEENEFDYGVTYSQLKGPGVIKMHNHGFYGSGVRIGVFDSGFNLDHPAFDSTNIIAVYDFINDTAYVGNSHDDLSTQHDHGTKVLGIIAGIVPGLYRGGAFDAEFLLAKTEDISDEYQQEEYNWVSAVNWAYDNDVDIITSSLGYSDWYTFDSLDGDKAITTEIADFAASLGILVVNSAGNDRFDFGHITPPADGDSVLTVGAQLPDGYYAGFSSPGPTFDGRIKPDVTAQGSSVWLLSPNDTSGDGFYQGNGTSYSCPIVAATCALVMQATRENGNPLFGWDLALRLKETADMNCTPDNDYGWGRPIAPIAAGISFDDENLYRGFSFSLVDSSGNRTSGVVTLSNEDTTMIFNSDRRGVLSLYPLLPDTYMVEIDVDAYPIVYDTLILSNSDLTQCNLIDISDTPEPEGNSDFKIYPVPANDRLTISRANMQEKQLMTLLLFDASGNPCFDDSYELESLERAHTFDLTKNNSNGLASGIYFAVIYISQDGDIILEEKKTIIINRQ